MARKRKVLHKPTAYDIMWLMVMFDLPVHTKKQMRLATQFRNSLLSLGFSRKQFSVYMRHCENMEAAKRLAQKVGICLLDDGEVSVMYITDRQYGLTQNFYGKNPRKNEQIKHKECGQLFLF